MRAGSKDTLRLVFNVKDNVGKTKRRAKVAFIYIEVYCRDLLSRLFEKVFIFC